MKPKVSVIVPIYNVEPYLKQCVDSIRNQTLKDIEIILVDDGSPDRCPEMCDQFAKEDNRIRVIHQENQGVSVARNNGVKAAVGEWLSFCDPDDWMDEAQLSALYAQAEQEAADIAICGCYRINEDSQMIVYNIIDDAVPTCVFCGKSVMELAYECLLPGYLREQGYTNFCINVPWGRIYRAELVRDIEFPKGIHPAEDDIYNYTVFAKAQKVLIVQKCLHYNRTYSGVMGNFQKNCARNAQKAIRIEKDCLERICDRKEFEALADRIETGKLSFVLKSYFFNPSNPDSYGIRKQELRQYLAGNTVYLKYPKNKPYYTLKQKITYYLLRFHVYWPFELQRLLRKRHAVKQGK